MGNIIWIASYPKSGSTWLRVFISNYLANSDVPVPLNDLDEYSKGDMSVTPYELSLQRPFKYSTLEELQKVRNQVHAYIAGTINDTLLMKTHFNYRFPDGTPAINRDVTRGAIYVVRNPLDVSVSYSDHLSFDLDETINLMGLEGNALEGGKNFIPQYLGSWSSHARNWIDSGDLHRLILRYEDMVNNPEAAFLMVLKFLKLPQEAKRFERALRFSSFSSLQEQEASEGFRERSPASEKFFRAGQYGQWRDVLNDQQRDTIIRDHQDVMTKLKYLQEDGSPRF